MSPNTARLVAFTFSLCVCAFVSQNARAAALEFALDPIHSQVVFQISHAGFSDSTGLILRPEGTLKVDPSDCAGAKVEIRMQASNVEFNDAEWNKAVRGKSYFNAEQFPEIRFSGTRCEMLDSRHAVLDGELSLLGVRRAVELQVTFNKRANHPYTLKDTIGFGATTVLKRSDFGMSATPKTIGDEVRVRIAVEAVRVKKPTRHKKR